MTTTTRMTPGAFALTALLLATPAIAQPTPRAETDLNDQEAVAITVYNDGQGLVRDVRTVQVPAGPFTLAWRDVASAILTQSVSLVDETNLNGIDILEQNYQYDLIDRNKLIEKYLGKRVQVRMYDDTTERYVTKDAILLAPDVVEIGGKIYPGIPGQLILPELPGGLISVPTLEWNLIGREAGAHKLAMSYLTGGMAWSADYVAVINAEENALSLNGWTTISNNSGTTYNNAMLKLIAGDVHRVTPQSMAYGGATNMAEEMMARPSAPQFEEKAFFEYHLYTLQRPATLRNNEQKQIALLDAAKVPAVKKFVFEAPGDYWYWNPSDSQKVDIQVKMEFENKQDHGLGIPLPKGIVRVYKADTDETLQFIGEDSIDHTPKDETLRLFLGNAFDIAGERVVANRRKITDDIWEYDVTVKLRNHKTTAVTISVIDKIQWGDWSITKSTAADPVKRDASTVEFLVNAKPDVETLLTYTIRREY